MNDIEQPLPQEWTSYILLRTDLPSMNPGKAAAQVHHAGVQMVAKYGDQPLVRKYLADGIRDGASYFNTTLVLGATLDDINRINNLSIQLTTDTVVFDTVTDPSYPFFVENLEIAALIPQTSTTKLIKVLDSGKVLMVREEITCAWYLGDRNNTVFKTLFDGLNLHP